MNKKESSSYQQYLPAILQQDIFISQFLLAFEKILSGLNETANQEKIITANTQNPPGLEEIIDHVYLYFNPEKTPEEFLPWLAGWVALSLRDDWKVEVKKAFIKKIVGLYPLRGTKQGLMEILSIYLKNSGFGEKVEIFDQFTNFPNYFQVQLTLKDRNPDRYWRQAKIAKAIIDQEKPAHTFYALKILVPTMQLTQRSHVAYTFKLFAPPQEQKFTIQVIITPNNNNISLNQLAKDLVVQLQGNSKPLTIDLPQIIIDNQSFSVNYALNYQHLQDNLAGFNVILSNQTDQYFNGNLAINFYFGLNEIEHSNTLFSQSISLSPVLKINRQNDAGEIIEGNTTFQQANQPGMIITEYMWSQPFNFQIFEPPKIQELQPDIIAILEKIELEAIVKITQPTTVTLDLLNKITVRLADDFSDYNLFTPETSIENKQIKIKRTIYYQHFMQNINQLAVTIKNLNNVEIGGEVIVQATVKINQRLSTYQLLKQTFQLSDVPPYNILQICQRNESGTIITGETIPTILGTTSQPLN
ncbi:MAG TPA: phage tail protein [Nostocaceae cyanobacterium]|nr:phage tail protein [Nostocaceae cyanobacterium]